ncbi:hypothetical protein [Clostridium gelidum]|uniref:hypothetical protein n=1 Tax=Clostridium gelidum TaxID=704125 RepID=UPI001CC58F2B|nr:hypothetical protein [Clostridium gelidum]
MNVSKTRTKGYSFVKCYIREFGCRYFFIRSCSIFACPKLVLGACRNGATSNVRNPQPNSQ